MSYEAWGEPDDSSFDAAIEAGWLDPTDLTRAPIDVMNERDRQHNEEGWTTEHDDKHDRDELSAAAACYAYFGWVRPSTGQAPTEWPWAPEWWKPTDRRRDLVKAAALILAEIERLDRAAAGAKAKTSDA